MTQSKTKRVFSFATVFLMLVCMIFPTFGAEVEEERIVAEEGETITQFFSDYSLSKIEQTYYVSYPSVTFKTDAAGVKMVKIYSQTLGDGSINPWTEVYVDDTIISKPEEHQGFPAIDDGYSLMVLYNPCLIADTLPDMDATYEFTFSLPVPDGYVKSTAKYYDGTTFKDVDGVTQREVQVKTNLERDKSIGSSAAGYIMGFTNAVEAYSGILVEYKKENPTYIIYDNGVITEERKDSTIIGTIQTADISKLSYDADTKTLSANGASADGLYLLKPVTVSVSGACELKWLQVSMENAADEVVINVSDDGSLVLSQIYDDTASVSVGDGVIMYNNEMGQLVFSKDSTTSDEPATIVDMVITVAEKGESVRQGITSSSSLENKYSDNMVTIMPTEPEITLLKESIAKYSDGSSQNNCETYIDDTIASKAVAEGLADIPKLEDGYTLLVRYVPGVYARTWPDKDKSYEFIFTLPAPDGYDKTSARVYGKNGYVDVAGVEGNSVVAKSNMKYYTSSALVGGSIISFDTGSEKVDQFGYEIAEFGIYVEYKKSGNKEVIEDTANSVSVAFDEGVLPAGTVIKSEKVESGEKYDNAKKIVVEEIESTGNITENVAVFEINLDADGTEIHDLGNNIIEVTMPVPIELSIGSTLKVYRVNDDGSLTECEAKVDGDKVTFKTNHFSTYVFAEVKDTSATLKAPNTGDADMPLYWLLVMIVSLGLVLGVASFEIKSRA